MLVMLYFCARFPSSSTLTLQNLYSGCSCESSSINGLTILHGAHQLAQKSTKTVLSLFKTSFSKFKSFNVTTLILPPVKQVLDTKAVNKNFA